MASDTWPAVEYEELVWDSHLSDTGATRADRQRSYGRYRAAVPPMIGGRRYRLGGELAGAVDDATAELARYDADLAGRAPVLDSIMLRTESAASSQIENLSASARSIALAELGDTTKPNATLVVANAQAMRRAIELADDLNPLAVLAMHRALLQETDPVGAGQWRQEPVWIGTSSLSPVDADFVAPAYQRVAPLIDDVMAYARQTDQPVLSQAALAHAQFETIHPFTDGNGRTGRALLHAMLRHHRLTRHVTVPISAGLLHDVGGYHDALMAYRTGNPEPILERLVDATFRAIRNGRRLATDIEQLRGAWRHIISARRDSTIWQVADLFLARPVLDASEIGRQLGIQSTNVPRTVRHLVDLGVVTPFAHHRRGAVWRADQVLRALDEFSARAGRRTGV